MRRRAIVFAAAMAAITLLACGVALAANFIPCSGGLCEGTTGEDEMTGTSSTDYLYAKEGNDVLRGFGAFDDLRGGPATTFSTGEGATISTISMRTTGDWTASPPTVREWRTG